MAGEVSGDILGAGLIRALKNCLPNVRFLGIAGPRMKAEGMESYYEMEELSVMGITEVLVRIPRLLKIRKNLVIHFTKVKPDIFIGIDSPDFNISLERILKKLKICTIHYVSPSVWAWRKNRILKIGVATNNLLVLFPFEKVFYDRLNIPCQFIGHATADEIPLFPDKIAARRNLRIPIDAICISILPGSRDSEVKMISACFLTTAMILKTHFSKLEIIVPIVNQRCRDHFLKIHSEISPSLHIHLLNNQSHQAMIASDAALITSGTATLECMLSKCPMVVGYLMKPLTFFIAKHLVKIPWISLPNLLAGRKIVTELLQEQCKPENLVSALMPLLINNETRDSILSTFLDLHKKIRCNANKQAAKLVLDMINQ